MSHRRRRTTVVLALLLGSALLPVAAAAPASAAEGCLTEVPGELLDPGCDDTTPPETAFGATAPRINAAGWVNKKTLRVGLVGSYTDADVDPIAFECSLSLDPTPPTDLEWEDCPEDGVFGDLAETATKPYVLWARAIDSADAAITWSDGVFINGLDDEPGVDLDETPAKLTFQVDTVVPDTYVFDTPYDELTPELPMVTDPRPSFRLAATESAAFRCSLDGSAVPCSAGATRLRATAPGDHTFRVQAVDPAGNLDPSPTSTRFAVPTNLTGKGAGWKRVTHGDHLGGDYLVATRRGAQLTVKNRGFREVRLLAATGPGPASSRSSSAGRGTGST